jgi:hypothetical protein
MNLVVIGCATPELRFEVQEGAIEVRTGIGDKFGFRGVKDDDFIFKRCQELRRATAHQFGYPIATEQMTAIAGWVDPANQPFFVSNYDSSARGIGEHAVHWRFEVKIGVAFILAMVTCPVAFEAFEDILSFFPLGEPFIPLHRHDHDYAAYLLFFADRGRALDVVSNFG